MIGKIVIAILILFVIFVVISTFAMLHSAPRDWEQEDKEQAEWLKEYREKHNKLR